MISEHSASEIQLDGIAVFVTDDGRIEGIPCAKAIDDLAFDSHEFPCSLVVCLCNRNELALIDLAFSLGVLV